MLNKFEVNFIFSLAVFQRKILLSILDHSQMYNLLFPISLTPKALNEKSDNTQFATNIRFDMTRI